jgi:hypothetical protein
MELSGISEEYVAFIFTVIKTIQARNQREALHARLFLRSFFDPEDGSDMYLSFLRFYSVFL